MPRKKRIAPAGVPLHIVQRGVDGVTTFRDDRDRKVFLKWLNENAYRWQVAIHAWVLMNNHIHLLVTPNTEHATTNMMANLCGRYANYFNKRYQRTGGLWQGRFYSCIIASNYYLMCCYRYIELNPVRAGLVKTPNDYKWSSFRCNGMGYVSKLQTPHPCYLSLGTSKGSRLIRYQQLFTQHLANDDADFIRQKTQGGGILVKPENEEIVQTRLTKLY